MKHVTVFGTSHRFQGAEKFKFNIDDPTYQVVVDRLLHGKNVVFEEATGLGPTTAEKLTFATLGPGLYWDVDPPIECRHEHGIYETGRWEPIEPGGPCNDTLNYEFDSEQGKREVIWLRRIEEIQFERALFICGYLHVLSMSLRLRAAGYDVEACHYMPFAKLCGKQHVG
jgi:hypothetical protein